MADPTGVFAFTGRGCIAQRVCLNWHFSSSVYSAGARGLNGERANSSCSTKV